MARFLRFGFSMLAVAGLAACAARADAPKSVVLDDFERVPDPGLLNRQFDPLEAIKHPTYPAHDFDVATSGYASVTSLSKDAARDAKDRPLYEFIQGKSAAQVRFTVPGDYHAQGDTDMPTTWESGFGLTTESHTPLKVTDWSPYRYFDFRIYNPGSKPQTLYVRYNDASSSVTLTSVAVPKGESEVELPLDQLSEARLDSSDIRGVMLYLDTAGQSSDPVLMFDQLALYNTDAATRVKLAAEEDSGEDTSDDEDWDNEDSDVVRKVRVVHPGDALAAGGPRLSVGGALNPPKASPAGKEPLKALECLRLARPRQWSKNLLLFAGLLFAGGYRDLPAQLKAGDVWGALRDPARALLGFAAFVLLSSSVYALNDLRDAAADRLHPVKRIRPVAAGTVSKSEAALLSLCWAVLGLALSARLGLPFLALGLSYLALSTFYSLWTKHQVILDVLSLAAGFVLRAAAGAAAVAVRISPWLLVCSTLLALFLGFVKRRSELAVLPPNAKAARVTLAHYSLPLLDQMIAIVASATLMAYALYAFLAYSDTRGPWMMLTIPFVLYGILRYLYLAHQKGLGAAPEKVLLGDGPLQINLVLWVLCSGAIVALARP